MVLYNNQIAEGMATDSWHLGFYANGEHSGTFHSVQVLDDEGKGAMAFALRGPEVSDTACVELNGDRVGSTNPPDRGNICHLLSHKMNVLWPPPDGHDLVIKSQSLRVSIITIVSS